MSEIEEADAKVEVDWANPQAAKKLLQKFLGYTTQEAEFAVDSLRNALGAETKCTLTVCQAKPFPTLVLRADFVARDQLAGDYYMFLPWPKVVNLKTVPALLSQIWLRWNLRPDTDTEYQLGATWNINKYNILSEYTKADGFSLEKSEGGDK